MCVLQQTSHDLPALREKRERVSKKATFLRQQADKAEKELADLDAKILRREAHADAGIGCAQSC